MHAPPTDSATLPVQQKSSVDEGPVVEPSRGSRSGIPWWIWALAGALFFTYATLSLRIHQRMLSHSFDLGIFEQIVRSYAHGHLPVSEIKGPDFPILGDHFSPILALVAPVYRLWPSPMALLVVQAALIAASVLPLTLWARRALGSPPPRSSGSATASPGVSRAGSAPTSMNGPSPFPFSRTHSRLSRRAGCVPRSAGLCPCCW